LRLNRRICHWFVKVRLRLTYGFAVHFRDEPHGRLGVGFPKRLRIPRDLFVQIRQVESFWLEPFVLLGQITRGPS
jgi:hypothetical protein